MLRLMKNKNEIKIKYLVLWLADSCNLNCKYCYAHPNFTNKFMNFEIAKTMTMIAMTKTKINGKPVIYNDLLFCQL